MRGNDLSRESFYLDRLLSSLRQCSSLSVKPLSLWERGWGEGASLALLECALLNLKSDNLTRLCAIPLTPDPSPRGRGELRLQPILQHAQRDADGLEADLLAANIAE